MMLDDLAMITVDTPTYGVIQANIACLLSEYSPSVKAYFCLTAVAICYLNCCFSFFFAGLTPESYPKGPSEENLSNCQTGIFAGHI